MDWKVIETEPADAPEIMEKDRDLLDKIDLEHGPILHLYEWKKPSITYGHFLDPKKFFSLKDVEELGISIAKRPTGGGIIFHLWDLAFSVLVPASHPGFSQNTLENYAFVNDVVVLAVQDFLQKQGIANLTPEDGEILGAGAQHFCMAKPTRYDVMIEGKKVAGAAQRKTKKGFLHQGSISLVMPSVEVLNRVLLPELSVVSAMNFFTYPLMSGRQESIDEAKSQIRSLLKKYLTKR